MSTNEQYCAYIAKDKILGWIHQRVIALDLEQQDMSDPDEIEVLDRLIRCHIAFKETIEMGLFDFQRGSE